MNYVFGKCTKWIGIVKINLDTSNITWFSTSILPGVRNDTHTSTPDEPIARVDSARVAKISKKIESY